MSECERLKRKPSESLQAHISAVLAYSQSMDSPCFRIAISGFKQYLADEYQKKLESGEDRTFLDDLILSISLSQLNQNLLNYCILINAITKVDLGNKTVIATRISRDLLNLPPSSDQSVWDIMEQIFMWLSKHLGLSFNHVLYQFHSKIFDLSSNGGSLNLICALKLLSILIRKFPETFLPTGQIHGVIIQALQDEDKEVRDTACQTLNDSLTLIGGCLDSEVRGMCVTIATSVSSSPIVDGFVAAIQTIIEAAPPLASVFTFAEPPRLDPPSDSSLKLVPISYQCTPSLFNSDHIEALLKSYLSLITKKSSLYETALLSLGDFSFSASKRLHSSHEQSIQLILTALSKNQNDQTAYALLSLLSPSDPHFEALLQPIFSLQPTRLLNSGIAKFCKAWPEKARSIRKLFLPGLLALLASPTPIIAIESFQILEFPANELTSLIIARFSALLNSRDTEVKEAVSELLLNYYQSFPEIPFLAFVCTDSSDDLRKKILKKVSFHSEACIPFLYSLLFDRDEEIQIISMDILCSITEAVQIIRSHIKELSEIRPLTKSSVKCLLVAIKHGLLPLFESKQELIRRILCLKKWNSSVLYLLSSLITSDFKDIPALMKVVYDSLKPHSSIKVVDACLDVLNQALISTELNMTVTKSFLSIDPLLFEVSRAIESHEVQSKILIAISRIGIIKPQYLYDNLPHQNQPRFTPLFCLSLSESSDPLNSLTFASLTFASLTLLDIIGNESLATLHQSAMNSLEPILKNFQKGRAAQIVVEKLAECLERGGASTISTIFSKLHYFLNAFGTKMEELIPNIVLLIERNWGHLDSSTLLRAAKWLCYFLRESFLPFSARVSALFLSSLRTSNIQTATAILETVVQFGKTNIDCLPLVLSWIDSHSASVTEEIITQLRFLIIYYPSKSYSGEVVRILTNLYSNPGIQSSVTEAFSTILILYRDLSLFSDQPALRSPINAQIFDWLSHSLPIPSQLVKQFTSVPESIREKGGSSAKPKASEFVAPSQMPSDDWSRNDWETWFNDLISSVFEASPSRAISACKDLAERYSHIRVTLFPIAFAIQVANEGDCHSIMKIVMESENAPNSVVRLFLSSAELLEASGAKLPVNYDILSKRSLKARHFSQALRYAEELFKEDSRAAEFLMKLNLQMGLTSAADGILSVVKHTELAENTYQLLGLWEEAKKSYEARLGVNPDDENAKKGRMKCLEALSMYIELNDAAGEEPSQFSASAKWHMLQKDEFMKLIPNLRVETPDSIFYLAVASIMKGEFESASFYISKLRSIYVDHFFPMRLEDVQRDYEDFVRASQLVDIEDVIIFKVHPNKSVIEAWDRRLSLIREYPKGIFDSLCVRTLIFGSEEMQPLWKKFLEEYSSNGETQISKIAFSQLREEDDYLKALYMHFSDPSKAIELIRKSNKPLILGKWLLDEGRDDEAIDVLKPLKSDAEALLQFSRAEYSVFQRASDRETLRQSFIALLDGLCLSPTNHFAFTQRVFRDLFKFEELYPIFSGYIGRIPLYFFEPHIPQIIAKLANGENIEVLMNLLLAIGNEDPQTVIPAFFPLCSQSIAEQFFNSLKHPSLVREELTLRNELIRVATSLFEEYRLGIDEAYRLSQVSDEKAAAALLKLPPFDAPHSSLEAQFYCKFAGTLESAFFFLKRGEYGESWLRFLEVYRQCSEVVDSMKEIKLCDVSPLLSDIRDSGCSVPGTFEKKPITISRICQNLSIFASKQRPRQMKIVGSDGREYRFLLKANEDSRLDQRVMEIFSFVNALMKPSFVESLTTYRIVPLSTNVGLIGWVEDCATVLDIITNFRNKRHISLKAEMERTFEVEPKFAEVGVQQKAGAFLEGLRATNGEDLKDHLLAKSMDSSHWLQRRLTFSSSLALTSIVGYVLGLGDRHLRNIMVDDITAKIVHIDLGDCFEVASMREEFPETVPFRLTRIFVSALEVSGVEGSFKAWSMDVMKVIRENNEVLLGLLDTYINDPLLEFGAGGMINAGYAIGRVKEKLGGAESVGDQVDRLILEATDPRNLCQMYKGWGPWW